jgi:fluoride exporter
MQWVMVAVGGAMGSILRFAAVSYLTPFLNYRFPLGTFFVNILGSFLIGLMYVLFVEKAFVSSEWRLFFMTGVLGGFTTFSAFSLEMLQLWQEGQALVSISYATSSVVLGLLMVYAGVQFAQKIF